MIQSCFFTNTIGGASKAEGTDGLLKTTVATIIAALFLVPEPIAVAVSNFRLQQALAVYGAICIRSSHVAYAFGSIARLAVDQVHTAVTSIIEALLFVIDPIALAVSVEMRLADSIVNALQALCFMTFAGKRMAIVAESLLETTITSIIDTNLIVCHSVAVSIPDQLRFATLTHLLAMVQASFMTHTPFRASRFTLRKRQTTITSIIFASVPVEFPLTVAVTNQVVRAEI